MKTAKAALEATKKRNIELAARFVPDKIRKEIERIIEKEISNGESMAYYDDVNALQIYESQPVYKGIIDWLEYLGYEVEHDYRTATQTVNLIILWDQPNA